LPNRSRAAVSVSATAVELVAATLQILLQLAEIVELAVIAQPPPLPLKRLIGGRRQVNDRQPCMADGGVQRRVACG
jgi:hypothetical protein